MRTACLLACLLLLGLLPAAPAAAGNADDPDLTDQCAGYADPASQQVLTPPAIDVCDAWFSAVVSDDEVTTLTVTLRVAGYLRPRQASMHELGWRIGTCDYTVRRVDDDYALDAGLVSLGGEESQRRFEVVCDGDADPRTCLPPVGANHFCVGSRGRSVVLPADAFVEDGSRLRVTLRFAGALAPFAPAFRKGALLEAPRARTATMLGYTSVITPVACAEQRCTPHVHSDEAHAGRPYRIGS